MKIRLILLCILSFAMMASAQTTLDYVPGQALVRFEKPTTLKQARQELDPSLFTVEKLLVRRLDIYLVTFDSKLSVREAVEMLRGYPQLRWAQADHILKERLTPNDSQFGSLWNMHQTSDADIDAPEAWDFTTGGTDFNGDDIVIAIVDGGCQMNHPDLLANFWVNELEASGSSGVDDDGNGYVDDINGWDAYSEDGTIPSNGHGTHVSGIAGAVGNNGSQVCGVNWNVKLMEVAGSTNLTSVASIAYGYVIDQKALWISSGGTEGANIVSTNSSFGIDLANCESGDYPTWNDLYNSMGELGILSACATANAHYNIDTQGDVPTGCDSPYIISVTNTTSTDNFSSSAGYGATTIDLGAPGTNVTSTYPTSTTTSLSGTSMSTPHVAGAVALMHAAASASFYAYYQQYPDSAALALKQMILDAVDPLTGLDGITVSGGRLNLHNAVSAINGYIHPGGDEPFLRVTEQAIDDTPAGDGDGRFDPDETVDFIVSIENLGIDATNVYGSLVSNDAEVTVIDGSASFGDVDSLAVADNTSNPFVLQASTGVPLDFAVSLTLTLTADGDYEVAHELTIYVNDRVVVWSEDFESGENGWTHSNIEPAFSDQWHLSTTRYNSEDHAWKCGDTGSGNYNNRLDAGLLSPEITIPPNAKLSVMHWLEAEVSGYYPDSCYDGGLVEISTNGGSIFTQLTPLGGYTHTFRYGSSGGYTGPLPGVACFSNTVTWSEFTFDLASFAEETAQLRFRFCSDEAETMEGWYIDDVRIMGEPIETPDPVTDLTIWPSDNDIELRWTEPATGASYYRIYRSIISDVVIADTTLIGTSPTTSFIDNDVLDSMPTAHYIVIAVNE